MEKAVRILILIVFLSLFSWSLNAQTFPNPATLSTGQGTPGTLDPLWTVSDVYPSIPPNPIGLNFTPALINNNCAPGSWVDPASLPPPVNNGNWITHPGSPCATNISDGYNYFRLTLDLPTDCNGNGVTTVGSYVLHFSGYVDNTISDVFVNGTSMGISGGAFAAGTQLNFSLPGPWAPGLNYIDVLVYNFPNGGQANPYGLLLVPNSTASSIDSDNDGVADIDDLCPCVAGNNPNGCPPLISGDTVICFGETTSLRTFLSGDYLWSTGATIDSIIVSPTSTTAYSLTVTELSGTVHTATVNVTVHPQISAAINPAVAAICTGDAITLTASGGTGYVWDNGQTSTSITVSPTINTTYTVTVTDANGCSATASRNVTVNSLPVAAISPVAAAVCIGDAITLTASGGTGYVWDNSQTGASITVSPTLNTTYSVTVTDANGCTGSTTRNVAVKPLPTATVYDSICDGDTYVLPDGSPVALAGTYTSTVPGPDCDTVVTTYLTVNNLSQTAEVATTCQNEPYTLPGGAMVSSSGIYSDTLVNQFGCDSIIETTLTVLPIFRDTIVASICETDSWTLPDGTTVNQAGFYTSSLQSTLGCDSAVITDLTVMPTMYAVVYDTICAYQSYTMPGGRVVNWTDTFQDTIPASNSCDSIVTVHLEVIELTVSLTADSVLCYGENTGTIAAIDNGGISPITYQWSEPSFTGSSIGNAYAGVYHATATDAFGCTATGSVDVLEPAVLSFTAQVTDVSCFGKEDGSIAIAAQGGTMDYQLTVNGAPPTGNLENLPAGIYAINCTDANGCALLDTLMVTEPDSFELYARPDTFSMELGDTLAIEVSANYDPATQYVWDFNPALSCLDCPNPVLATHDTDTLWLTTKYLSSTQNVNCVNLFSLPVMVIEKKNLFIPTAFSPNGDGQNDEYRAYGNLKGLRIFKLMVFDRSGGKVFETDNPYFVWDGTSKGQLVSGGVFVYVVRYAWLSSWEIMHTEKGSLTIIR